MGEGNEVRALAREHPNYPQVFTKLTSPPKTIYLLGPWDHPGPHVAIVGARDATDDGMDFARELAGSLASAGVAVLSGLARGIDAAAHEGALDAGGRSGAVLGTPIDRFYPPRHAPLQRRLARSLGLMSEIEPGGATTPSTFATRNRILAALADAVLVVQGRSRSGSLLTADHALRMNKPVGAVPWDPREPLAEAPLELIHSGKAKLIRSAKDVLELLRVQAAAETEDVPLRIDSARPLPEHEASLYRALRNRPLPLDRLALAARLTPQELQVALLGLELSGLAARAPGGLAKRARRGA